MIKFLENPRIAVLRPDQWVKNSLVAVGFLFALADTLHLASTVAAGARCVAAVILFCFVSGAVYILNDIVDVERDRVHPSKCKRPIASGALSVRAARSEGIALALVALCGGALLGADFLVSIASYAVLQVVYTFAFKNVALLDVSCIAAGFALRVYAGTAATRVPVSPWILSCTFLGALLVALCKRRAELRLLGDDAPKHRPVLRDYSLRRTDFLIGVAALASTACYSAWTLAAETISKFGTRALFWTIVPMIFAVARFLDVARNSDRGGKPEGIVTHDVPFILAIVAYIVVFLVVK